MYQATAAAACSSLFGAAINSHVPMYGSTLMPV